MKDTPIIIISRDRKSCLQNLIECLLDQGYQNLYVLDNGSTYPPMLRYLESIRFPIHQGGEDGTHTSLWTKGIIDASSKIFDWYAVTDCDVMLDGPDDWLQRLRDLLDRYPDFPKAGLSLRIDDLPDSYSRKREVLDWEKHFWDHPVEPDVYDADIDTTLALYRPNVRWGAYGLKALRLAGPYQARHTPWYSDSANPTEEERYYKSHMREGVGFWR